ncbi:leucine-rich repeat domain-containing protein [Poritiphilus flavus]|uniref:Disease resistance R13L4/SHOC-2-like LRR domain-containing protein n=1 Tax=Poritiphilus flavus TaxID=2697053 RepID=A0A6L9EGK5_9FLAO|nr:leucine-rich repeat domain-containing protein [Poritiphilus flavus]NAS13776.1 hypothetical protein [Poritiphilus flavus]
MKSTARSIIVLLLGLLVFACSKDDSGSEVQMVESVPENPTPEPESKSAEKQITSFKFPGLEAEGVTVDVSAEIDQENLSVFAELPIGTQVTSLEPQLEVSPGATVVPTGPQDFTEAVEYTVTAENGSSVSYLATVEVPLSQKEILLRILELNPLHTLDWDESEDIGNWDGVTLDDNGNIIELEFFDYIESRGRRITLLPEEIRGLKYLEKLILTDNQLTVLPDAIGELNNLTILNLHRNKIVEIPSTIGQLEKLVELRLTSNRLENVPEDLWRIPSLEYLDLSYNRIQEMPSVLGELSKLKELHLSQNNFKALPPEISMLENLEILTIRDNDLTELPAEIGSLKKLEHLNLAFNDLTYLPAEFANLKNLKYLNLGANQLSNPLNLPLISSGLIVECKSNLEQLLLGGNPDLDVLPQCICDMDPAYGGTTDIDIVPDKVICQGDVLDPD